MRMRIAFLGKGGSGKSTIAAGFINHLNTLDSMRSVLAIDADLNAHLAEKLSLPYAKKTLGDNFLELAGILEPARDEFVRIGFEGVPDELGTLPPSSKSVFIQPAKMQNVLPAFASQSGRTTLLHVGKHIEKDIASSCYHTKLTSLEMVLNRTLDRANDYTVVDSNAGTDMLGTTLYAAYDLMIFVVEPTRKSVDVFKEFHRLLSPLNPNIFPLANKLETREDEVFIQKALKGHTVIGHVYESREMRAFEQTIDPMFIDTFAEKNKDNWEAILSMASGIERDWDRYFKEIVKLYHRLCKDWFNQFYGKDVDAFYEADFRYNDMLKESV